MRIIILFMVMITISVTILAQAPHTFSYQAVVRDNAGNILDNQIVSFRISILQDNATGLAVYVETHNTVTNQLGLINLEIGNGYFISGIFSNINWSADIFFLQIELDETGGINYQLMGTSQLLAVPYALEAAHARSLTLMDENGREYEVTIDENGNLVSNIKWICGDTLTDLRDNQKYVTVQIENYCWMAENMNIGIRIDGANDQTDNTEIEKYCYDDLESNCDTYGGLYQWDEMMQYATSQGVQGICPEGWHLPMDSEWTALTDYLGGIDIAGGAMKEVGTTHWISPNAGATNSSGFTALPGGFRNSIGDFSGLGNYGNFWASTESIINNAWRRYLAYSNANVVRINVFKLYALSVRCLKDYSTQPPSQPSDPMPGDGSIDIGIDTVLSWTCSDPEGHDLSYKIHFGTDSSPPVMAQGLTEATYDPMIYPDSTYYWKVVAFDVFGDSAVSNIWSFTTLPNQPPSQPSDPMPGDGSIDIGIDTVLSWTCSDPEGFNLLYSIYFGTDSDPSIVAEGLADATYTPVLDTNTTYYWKVVAFDNYGDSAVSNIWSFTTLPNQPPSQPSDPIPGDGSIDIGIDTVLFWTCSDPDGNDLFYKIHFGTDPNPPVIAEGLSEATYDPGILDYNTSYYWKVVAFDVFGDSAVSNVWSFTTKLSFVCSDQLFDIRDGQNYSTVMIGTQCWMAENLNIGIRINGDVDQTDNVDIEKYCYDDIEDSCDVYGGLYQWNELMQYTTTVGTQGICPDGWHIPTDSEWCILTQFIDPTVDCGAWGATGTDVGTKMKSTSGWSSSGNGTNESGFTALPSGHRDGYNASFTGSGSYGYFWSSTEDDTNDAWFRRLDYNYTGIYQYDDIKNFGFPVRCLKD